MRALFFGTPDIAVPALDALCDVAEVVGVVCQPDRPAGRGMKLRAPPVKARALERGLEVQQPTRIKKGDFPAWIESKQADVALVIAYGHILPARLLDAPRRGCMNLHASLLPKYRGAAPINWAIAGGETETGISLMQMDEGCDTGPVFSRHAIPIGADETAGELYLRLGALAADVVKNDLLRAVHGELNATPQRHEEASHARMMTKQDGLIDWHRPAQAVHDHARGMTPWPGAHTTVNGKRLKVLSTRVEAPDGDHGEPGCIVAIDARGAHVACKPGTVRVLRGQLEGKKPLDALQLENGRAIAVDTRLG